MVLNSKKQRGVSDGKQNVEQQLQISIGRTYIAQLFSKQAQIHHSAYNACGTVPGYNSLKRNLQRRHGIAAQGKCKARGKARHRKTTTILTCDNDIPT